MFDNNCDVLYHANCHHCLQNQPVEFCTTKRGIQEYIMSSAEPKLMGLAYKLR